MSCTSRRVILTCRDVHIRRYCLWGVSASERRLASINRPSTGSHNGDTGPPPPLLPVSAGGVVAGGVLVSPPELAAAGVAFTSVDAAPLPALLLATTVK